MELLSHFWDISSPFSTHGVVIHYLFRTERAPSGPHAEWGHAAAFQAKNAAGSDATFPFSTGAV